MSLLKSVLSEVLRRGKGTPPQTLKDQLDTLAQVVRRNQPAERPEAEASLRSLVTANPSLAEAHITLGDLLLASQRAAEAESCYRAALAIRPESARAQEGLGLALYSNGRFEDAYLHLSSAHQLEPMHAEILVHWGLVDLSLGNLPDAGSKFFKAIERDTRNANAWQNLGLVSYKLGQFADSVKQLSQAVELNPTHGLAYSNLALALRQLNDLSGAIECALKATTLKPNNARVWVVLGDLYCDRGDFGSATQAHTNALEKDPNNAATFIGLGKVHQASGDFEAARTDFQRALALDPHSADARGGLAQLHLLLGEWLPGWAAYEARRLTQPSPVRTVHGPEWMGESLAGKRVLIHAEQGLGDVILFASCVPDLLAMGAECILDVPPRLENLFRRSFPSAQVFGHDMSMRGDDWLSRLPPFDLHVPIGSLPRWTRQSAASFPNTHSFLRADPERIADWTRRLAKLPRPLIGLSWRGGLASTAGQQRTLSLETMVRAFGNVHASFVCLQYGDVTEELQRINQTSTAVESGLCGYGDLDDWAALTATLDGVITVCSTQAHLCGALGVSSTVLVPSNPSWRYGAHGTSMPWYPSLKLLRQAESGQWEPCLVQAREWLEALSPVTPA